MWLAPMTWMWADLQVWMRLTPSAPATMRWVQRTERQTMVRQMLRAVASASAWTQFPNFPGTRALT
jgi:hypothetical protein